MNTKTLYNPENINGLVIELTPEEIAQREQDAIQAEQDRLVREQAEQAKIDAKASALAIL
jgi:hypothetical protein